MLTPCSPSAPPVHCPALLAPSRIISATTRVSMSSVRPSVRNRIRPVTTPSAAATAPAASSPVNGSVQPCTARIPAV